MLNRDWAGWALLGVAVVIGGVAFWLVNNYLASRENQMRLSLLSEQAETTQVVVASRDVSPGDVVSSKLFSVAEMPTVHVPDRAITPKVFERVDGHVLNRQLSAGEMLQADFVAGMLVERFSGLLAEGERAISVEVSSAQTYAGMLLPGDYIDLYVSLPETGDSDKPRLIPVLERVKVLAAGAQPLRNPDQSFQRLSQDGTRYSLITVGLPRAKAERLEMARQAGDIVFLLRNADDRETGQADAAYALFGGGSEEHGYWYISNGVPQGEVRALGEQQSEPDTAPSASGVPAVTASATAMQSPGSRNTTPMSQQRSGAPASPSVSQTAQAETATAPSSSSSGRFERTPIVPYRDRGSRRSASPSAAAGR